MVKVKVVKLPNCVPEDDKYIKLGQVYEAFELRDEECGNDFYHHFYALNIGVGTFHISPENVEVVEEVKYIIPDQTEEERERALKMFKDKGIIVPTPSPKILLVEDGSVNLDELNEKDIQYIVYRKGAQPPFILEI